MEPKKFTGISKKLKIIKTRAQLSNFPLIQQPSQLEVFRYKFIVELPISDLTY